MPHIPYLDLILLQILMYNYYDGSLNALKKKFGYFVIQKFFFRITKSFRKKAFLSLFSFWLKKKKFKDILNFLQKINFTINLIRKIEFF